MIYKFWRVEIKNGKKYLFADQSHKNDENDICYEIRRMLGNTELDITATIISHPVKIVPKNLLIVSLYDIAAGKSTIICEIE